MADIKKVQPQYPIPVQDEEYVKLVSQISNLWDDARNKAFQAVNSSLLMTTCPTWMLPILSKYQGTNCPQVAMNSSTPTAQG